MDNSVITNPEDIILIRVNRAQDFYAKIIDVTVDSYKKGWWNVRFYPLVPTKDFKLREAIWKLDDQQIRGEEFTMNGIPHQLFKVEYEVKTPDERPKYNITKTVNQDADAPVPLPENKDTNITKAESKYERPYLKLVK